MSSLRSISTGTAISNISMAVTLQFDGKLSNQDLLELGSLFLATVRILAAAQYWVPSSVSTHGDRGPDRRTATIANHLIRAMPSSALKISDGMTWPMTLRELPAAHDSGLRMDPLGASSVTGVMQPSLFGVSGSRRHFNA